MGCSLTATSAWAASGVEERVIPREPGARKVSHQSWRRSMVCRKRSSQGWRKNQERSNRSVSARGNRELPDKSVDKLNSRKAGERRLPSGMWRPGFRCFATEGTYFRARDLRMDFSWPCQSFQQVGRRKANSTMERSRNGVRTSRLWAMDMRSLANRMPLVRRPPCSSRRRGGRECRRGRRGCFWRALQAARHFR